MKKYSMIGLVLLAASAVTAAFIPAKKDASGNTVRANGHLTQSTGNQVDRTCREALSGDVVNCNWTDTGVGAGLSGSSALAIGSATALNPGQTGTNTTI